MLHDQGDIRKKMARKTNFSVMQLKSCESPPPTFLDKIAPMTCTSCAPNKDVIIISLANRTPKSHENLICFQEDAKQCCDISKLCCTHCSGHILCNILTPKERNNNPMGCHEKLLLSFRVKFILQTHRTEWSRLDL